MHYKSRNGFIKHIDFLILDIIALVISFLAANMIRFHRLDYYDSSTVNTTLSLILMPALLINISFNPYSGILRRDNIEEFRKVFQYTAFYLLSYIFVSYLLKIGSLYSRIVIALTYICFLILSFLTRIFWKQLIISGKVSFISPERIPLLIVSRKKDISMILENMNQSVYHRYDIKGICVIDDPTFRYAEYDSLHDLKQIHEYAIANNIREVYFYLAPQEIGKELPKSLVKQGIGVQLNIESIFGFETDHQIIDKVGIDHTLGLGLFVFTPAQVFYLGVKRIFDIIISLAAMILMIPLALIIKLSYLCMSDRSPIFFTQERIGLDGKKFQLYKFRSMVSDADVVLKELLKDKKNKEEWDEYHKFVRDPRVTKVGTILRKTSLDEFPQFINVLKGEMSIVGPRPLVEGELEMHNGLKLYERVKPGITGWWACNGRSNISYRERLELEYYYVKNCSFFLDVLTILRTAICVLKKTGAR